MTTIVTRVGKGSTLTWNEVDANFTNLNADKLDIADIGISVQAYSANLSEYAAVNPTSAGLALLDDADASAQRTTLGLGNVDNTSDTTKNSATATLTNKTISGSANTITNLPQSSIGTNVAGTGPVFSASASANQTQAVNSFVKLSFDTEAFDTNSNYDPTTNYRFTPQIAGYYQINLCARIGEVAATYGLTVAIYKNGSFLCCSTIPGDSIQLTYASTAILVYMNGTTDYVEGFAQPLGSSGSLLIRGIDFSGALVRAG
jgi:hypothetical protein